METETVSGEGTYIFGYDEMGRSSELTFPDGHQRHQRYDELGRLTSRCYEYSLGTLRCYTAQFDAVGNPVRMTDPDGVDVLEYDGLDRLKKVTRYLPDGATQVGVEDSPCAASGSRILFCTHVYERVEWACYDRDEIKPLMPDTQEKICHAEGDAAFAQCLCPAAPPTWGPP